jgi:hypothetical protein
LLVLLRSLAVAFLYARSLNDRIIHNVLGLLAFCFFLVTKAKEQQQQKVLLVGLLFFFHLKFFTIHSRECSSIEVKAQKISLLWMLFFFFSLFFSSGEIILMDFFFFFHVKMNVSIALFFKALVCG